MKLSELEMLHRLGLGESIDSVCEAVSIHRDEFDRWWHECAARRVPVMGGSKGAAVNSVVQINRDARGIPHIHADNDDDLFFGFGFAMAQDRLFQLDYLRRKGSGRLSEILGTDGLELDLVARTVGLRRIAELEWGRLSVETQSVLESFSNGINAVIEDAADNRPIEFDLLDYRPEPWTAIDSLTIECEFRWYLTGRFPVIVIPELAKRALGDGDLFREFTLGEADEEAIMPPGSYTLARPGDELRREAVGQSIGGPDEGTGSNNWVVSGRHTESGKPMVASDPHIAFEAVSCWYQAHLCGGSFNVAGMSYVGMPAIMFGSNERVAWGITNNICSQRDLYQERTDTEHPGCFLFDGNWEPAGDVTETILVKDGDPIVKTIRFSRNGPIVDEILPPPGNKAGPVSLNWHGAHQGGWLTALLNMDRAANVDEFNESLRPWHVPTFCLVFADVDGKIGLKASGRVPIRKRPERGYRDGWNPEHQWDGLIPFEEMPGIIEPERGWMATANNRLTPDDFAYPLEGRWGNGYRARRIRQMIERHIAEQKLSKDDFLKMQYDTTSLRAIECVPKLLAVLSASDDPTIQAAAEILDKWNCRAEPHEVGPTLFNVFFTNWAQKVAAERFASEALELMARACEGIASRLLSDDSANWFDRNDREQKILDTFRETIDYLAGRFGDDMNQWTWSQLHVMPLKHVLSGRGDLGELLDHGGDAVTGDYGTVCNTGSGADWTAASGAGFRMIADLSSNPPALWTVDGQSQSGNPGSPQYSDQFQNWVNCEFAAIPLEREQTADAMTQKLTLQPK